MIRYITRDILDLEKYDMCIANAVNSRVYAYSWYLDIVADTKWDVLVLNDYTAVMPLPKRRKYFINYVYQPPWSQQLGVFSLNEINDGLVEKFINAIPKKFKLVDVFLNAQNSFKDENIKERTNYVLSLNISREKIKEGYNNNRKRISNGDFNNYFIDKKANLTDFIQFYKKQNFKFEIGAYAEGKLFNLLNAENDFLNIWLVYDKNKTVVASLVCIKDKSRITYIFPIANQAAKKANIPTFIINSLIDDYQNTHYLLDFEGSMINGVANFYKSFGTRIETYYHFKKYQF